MTLAGHSWKKNGSAWSASSIASVSSTTWDVTMGTAASYGDTLLRSYATGHATVDTSSNELAAYTDSAVTNSIAGFDSDASAFFTASGVTNTTQKNAINQLVLDLKAASIWSKIKVLYPFVGGDSTKHSYNLKNPALYQISYGGTALTHDSNGVTGTSGYADTAFITSTEIASKYSMSAFVYNKTNAAGRIMSGYSSGCGWEMMQQTSGGNWKTGVGNSQTVFSDVSNSDARGCYVTTRTSATVLKSFRNGTQLGSTVTTDVTATDPACDRSIVLFDEKVNNTTQGLYSTLNLALWGMGDGLNDTEVGSLNTAIVAYETALSRA
jgi:hypothetical protein